MSDFDRESMLEMYLYESAQNLEVLEQCMIGRNESDEFTLDEINEIFRIMHTIKGSSAMMLYTSISAVAHAIEDLFFYIREEKPAGIDYSTLTDLVLEGQDFIKSELEKIETGQSPEGDGTAIITRLKSFLAKIKGDLPAGDFEDKPDKKEQFAPSAAAQPETPPNSSHFYRAIIWYEDGCEMENIRAFTLIHNLKDLTEDVYHFPEDIIEAEKSIEIIRSTGFTVFIASKANEEEMKNALMQTVYLRDLNFKEISEQDFKDNRMGPLEVIADLVKEIEPAAGTAMEEQHQDPEDLISEDKQKDDFDLQTPEHVKVQKEVAKIKGSPQQMISVHLSKLDSLLNLMGELVIAEAMVTQNPDLEGLELDGFNKAARQLHKIINDVQDTVMSIRMVPLSTTFYKMNRIVRDMSKQLGKEVELEIVGEETEVDKNIIEHISDPLMHIIRNSIDHGIEKPDERMEAGKLPIGTVRLEAKNAGNDVIITVEDDGKGLDRDAILEKAMQNGLLKKLPEEYSDKEIYNFIFMPGFSTNKNVTEYSGRGVGMDVALTNIGEVGGSILVDSEPGQGSTFTLKIPLTLAIVDGMLIQMGEEKYTIPISSIVESFKAEKEALFHDPDGNEMIMVRGESYNIIRMYEFFDVETKITNIEDGILVMLENNEKTVCLFTDDLVGEQQVVTKALPKFINPIRGIGGCTLLGNGDISLIIDVAGFFDN